MVKTRQWILANKPTDLPQLEGPNPTFELKETDLPDLQDDQVLVKAKYLSNDPAQRGWISKGADPERLYVAPVKEGEPMAARGICEVVESKSSKYKVGDTVIVSIRWSEYGIFSPKECQPAPEIPGGYGKTHYLGALGLPGLTAYFGLTEVVATKAEDVVVISGAAGATGMMAVQIAKHIIGCKKVIGMAGSDDKCKWVEGLGADLCLNCESKGHIVHSRADNDATDKKDSFQDDLKKALPSPDGFANVYFDNVGGEILDFMLTRMAREGRIACCGAISAYNTSKDNMSGLKNWFEMITMRLMGKFSQNTSYHPHPIALSSRDID